MKTEWAISGITEERVGAALYLELVALAPDNVDHGIWHLRTSPDDPRVSLIEQTVARHGRALCLSGAGAWSRTWTNLSCSLHREYESVDLSSFEYLRACGRNERWWSAAWAQPDGPIQLIAKKFRGKVHLRAAGHRLIVVSDHLRKIVESAGMKHCVFRPAVLVNDFLKEEGGPDRFRPIPWEEFGQPPWWHLTSDITLPPLNLEHIRLVDLYGKPFPNGWRRGEGQGCWVVEGWYHDPELHYKEQAIRAIEPFDVACIHEPWGYNDGQIHRGLVVSQRFRQLCEEHKVGAVWEPVRLDP